jgi:hypothetical protein
VACRAAVTSETRPRRLEIKPLGGSRTLSIVVTANVPSSIKGDCIMTYLTSIRVNPLRRILPVAFAAAAIALVSARAHAADSDQLDPVQLDPITISAPAATIVDRDTETFAPIEQVTIKARIQTDPAALATKYGALMLHYSVLDAAREACAATEPVADSDDDACVHDAVESAQPQVDAAIARARSSFTG